MSIKIDYDDQKTEKHDAIVRWMRRKIENEWIEYVKYIGFPGSEKWQKMVFEVTESVRYLRMVSDAVPEKQYKHDGSEYSNPEKKRWDSFWERMDNVIGAPHPIPPTQMRHDVIVCVEKCIGNTREAPDILVLADSYSVYWYDSVIDELKKRPVNGPPYIYDPKTHDTWNRPVFDISHHRMSSAYIYEIKSTIASEGGLMRQLSRYRNLVRKQYEYDLRQDIGLIVVSPDIEHEDFLVSEGINFIKCPTPEEIVEEEKSRYVR